MSSATSTRRVRPKPDTPADGRRVRLRAGRRLQPWQFFVLAALGCAAAAAVAARGRDAVTIVMLAVQIGATTLVGLGTLRTLWPLVSPEEDHVAMIGRRTRVALDREKMLALRSIKELEFDRAMGKLSDSDWQDMSGRLRARAARLMRQLDAASGYRGQIERDLAKRLGQAPAPAGRVCATCATPGDRDARFCKNCGSAL
jgi:hypothetical protein